MNDKSPDPPDLAAGEADAGAFSQLPDGGRRQLTIGSCDVTVLRLGSKVIALRNQCPHSNARLGDGVIRGREIECPIHHWRFDLTTGSTKRDPRLRATIYPVRVAADRILVRIPGLSPSQPKKDPCDSSNPHP